MRFPSPIQARYRDAQSIVGAYDVPRCARSGDEERSAKRGRAPIETTTGEGIHFDRSKGRKGLSREGMVRWV